MSRRQIQYFTHIFKQFSNKIERQYFISNHRAQLIQIRTNMPGIGFLIRKIAFDFLKIQKRFRMLNPMAACRVYIIHAEGPKSS